MTRKMRSCVLVLVYTLGGCIALGAGGATAYRGACVDYELVEEEELALLARGWNANLVRICLGMTTRCGDLIPSEASQACCAQEDLRKLDRLIDACEAHGLRAIVCLHQFVGYRVLDEYEESPDLRLWTSTGFQEALIAFWKTIAARYTTRGDVIYGYDLLNEPRASAAETWLRLVKRITTAIREVDPNHAIIVESRGGRPKWFRELKPTGDSNTIYSFHLWEPAELTHQGVWGIPIGAEYPSEVWNKQYLVNELEPVVEFQRQYGVPVLAGEIGVYATVEPRSRTAYLRDALDLFEEYGYDYTYWSYRTTPNSSLEHGRWLGEDGEYFSHYEGSTPLLALFREYLSRNSTIRPSTAGIRKPRCLFDTAHRSRAAADTSERAMNLAWRLTGTCDITYHTDGSITPEVLSGVALLVSGNPHGLRYTTEEGNAIRRFVEAGGAFLFYTNHANDGLYVGGVNALIDDFGIRFDGALIASPEPAWVGADASVFWTKMGTPDHPIAGGDFAYFLSRCGSLTVTPPAVAVASTENDTWKDIDGDLMADTGEPVGPFCVIATSEYGGGRVVVIADDDFKDVCNARAQVRMIRWLLADWAEDVRPPSAEENSPPRAYVPALLQPTHTLPLGAVGSVTFSKDGRYLAVAGDAGMANLVDTSSWEVFQTRRMEAPWVGSVAFSPDGSLLASASGSDIAIHDVTSGRLLRSLTGHSGWVFCVAFSPDGALIASSSSDQTVRVWDAATGDEVSTLAAHTLTGVDPVSWTP